MEFILNYFSQFDVESISRKYIELHKIFAPEIIRIMKESIEYGYMVNGPMWWIDPSNPDAMDNGKRMYSQENLMNYFQNYVNFDVIFV